MLLRGVGDFEEKDGRWENAEDEVTQTRNLNLFSFTHEPSKVALHARAPISSKSGMFATSHIPCAFSFLRGRETWRCRTCLGIFVLSHRGY